MTITLGEAGADALSILFGPLIIGKYTLNVSGVGDCRLVDIYDTTKSARGPIFVFQEVNEDGIDLAVNQVRLPFDDIGTFKIY